MDILSDKIVIPRKIKKQITTGFYCYTGEWFDIKTGIYHIKECVFYKRVKAKTVFDKLDSWHHEVFNELETQKEKDDFLEDIIHWCKLCQCEPLDQTKSCGLKYGLKNNR
jgi:hypothetical protein